MEEKLPPAITSELTKILLNTKEAQLLLSGYVSGKGIEGKMSIIAEFTITTE